MESEPLAVEDEPPAVEDESIENDPLPLPLANDQRPREADVAAAEEKEAEIAADFHEEIDAGLVRHASALIHYEQDPATAVFVSPDEPDSAIEETLTVEQVMEVALTDHPLLQERQQEIEIARAQLVGAGLLPNPQLVLDTDAPIQESRPTTLGGRVTWTFPTWGKRKRREAVASAGIVRAEFALSRETESVMAEAADAALEVLYLQELLTLENQLSKIAAKGAEIQRSRFQANDVSFADTVQADADAAAVELDRRRTIARLGVARMRLSRAMGQTRPRLVRIEGELFAQPLAPVRLDTVLTVAQRNRPELAEAYATVAESQHALALAYAEAHPDPTLGPRYQDRLGTDDDEIGARFSIDLPMFDRNQDGISGSIARIRADRARSRVTELTSLNDVASAYLELTSLQYGLQYYEDEVAPLAERTEADFLTQFDSEAIGADQASALLQNFAKMRVNHLQLRYRCDQLRTRLELLLGCRLADLQSDPLSDTSEAERAELIPMPEPIAPVEAD